MTSITTLLKRILLLSCYEFLFTDADSLIYEIKSKMFMKNFMNGKICLISVTTQKIQSFLTKRIRKLLAK